MRLDSEYVWEGEEMMYEDIVASTHPLNYNLHTVYRKHPDNYNFFPSHNYLDEDEVEEQDMMNQVEFEPE
jgi:hypothetical protein